MTVGARYYPLLLAYVELDSTNNALRVRRGGAVETVAIGEGIYWLGLGDAAGDDVAHPFLGVSLLQQFDADVGFQPQLQVFGGDVGASPDTEGNHRGHVWMTVPGANWEIQWSDSATTFDRRWLGVATDTATTAVASGAAVDVSAFSSSLALAVRKQPELDYPVTRPRAIYEARDDQHRERARGFGQDEGRRLRFRSRGDKDLVDGGYHAARRFFAALDAGHGCVYVPDCQGFLEYPEFSADERDSLFGAARYFVDGAVFDPEQTSVRSTFDWSVEFDAWRSPS